MKFDFKVTEEDLSEAEAVLIELSSKQYLLVKAGEEQFMTVSSATTWRLSELQAKIQSKTWTLVKAFKAGEELTITF